MLKTKRTDLPESEISLLDIIEFLKESWKTIASFTVLGIAGAVIFLWVAPKQYEATAQIKMAQIGNITTTNTTTITPLGINIEEPQALIARMALPTSYPKETIVLCGLTDKKDADEQLAKKVKLSIPKGVGGTVDLKIRDDSEEIAKACANAVYHIIKFSQTQFIAPFIDEARKRLAIEEGRLSRATKLIAKADKSGTTVSAIYLSTRDEIRFLLDQISLLQSIITSSENRATQLTAPIYLESKPVFPQKSKSLQIGLLIGAFLGLVFALVRKWYQSNYFRTVTLKPPEPLV